MFELSLRSSLSFHFSCNKNKCNIYLCWALYGPWVKGSNARASPSKRIRRETSFILPSGLFTHICCSWTLFLNLFKILSFTSSTFYSTLLRQNVHLNQISWSTFFAILPVRLCALIGRKFFRRTQEKNTILMVKYNYFEKVSTF